MPAFARAAKRGRRWIARRGGRVRHGSTPERRPWRSGRRPALIQTNQAGSSAPGPSVVVLQSSKVSVVPSKARLLALTSPCTKRGRELAQRARQRCRVIEQRAHQRPGVGSEFGEGAPARHDQRRDSVAGRLTGLACGGARRERRQPMLQRVEAQAARFVGGKANEGAVQPRQAMHGDLDLRLCQRRLGVRHGIAQIAHQQRRAARGQRRRGERGDVDPDWQAAEQFTAGELVFAHQAIVGGARQPVTQRHQALDDIARDTAVGVCDRQPFQRSVGRRVVERQRRARGSVDGVVGMPLAQDLAQFRLQRWQGGRAHRSQTRWPA